MAATIAKATGYDRAGRIKSVHRLGSEFSQAQAATWRTFATAQVDRNGTGYVEVRRDGKIIHAFQFGPEA